MAFRIIDGELLRLVHRACEYNTMLYTHVLTACKQECMDPQTQTVLSIVKADVEMMEHQPISIEDLIENVASANPINFEDILPLEKNNCI